jgi:hypothetical protein
MLINKNETLKSLLGGIQTEMHWKTWGPFVTDAENDHIIRAIGQELYDYLNTKVDPAMDTLSGSAQENTLIKKLRTTLGHYTEMESALSILVQKGDGGMSVASPPNMQAPGKWMIVGKISESRDKADRHMEAALQYLENNKGSFPVWTASSAYTISHSLFLSSATEYSEYFPAVRESRRLYVALRGFVKKSEKDFISPLVGEAQFSAWKAKLLTNDAWTAPEMEALTLLRTALANDAFKRGMPYLNLNSEFRLVSETDGIKNEDILSDSKINAIRSDTEKESAEYASKLKRILDNKASATVFPEYFASEHYKPTKRKSYQPPTNCDPAIPFEL